MFSDGALQAAFKAQMAHYDRVIRRNEIIWQIRHGGQITEEQMRNITDPRHKRQIVEAICMKKVK